MTDDLISRQAAIDLFPNDALEWDTYFGYIAPHEARRLIEDLPSAQSDGYVRIPETGIDDLSDGFHTFRQLYYQRMMLFATIVKQNREKAWKSLRHEDGELCFGGDWFIVGIDTPKGTYTYHYEANYYSMFDCKELERAKHWDGHTEKDVTRLLSLPSAQSEPEEFEWCNGCKEYDQEKHCCHRWTKVIRKTVAELKQSQWTPCSEGLPKEADEYQITCKDQYGDTFVKTTMYFPDCELWWGVPSSETVTAWMPKPKPYGVEK